MEKSRLIQPLGRWIIAQACRDILHWRALGQSWVPVALNLSLRQLQEQNFLARFLSLVDSSGVPAHCLEWEITESTMMRHPDVVLAFMHGCRERGVRFSIDDFGTGYSSLSLLSRLPVDKIKIDRTFIQGVEHDHSVQVILGAIVGMARRLGLAVVAEGVEEGEQLQYLHHLECDGVQGYYFSRPLDRDGITAFLGAHAQQRGAAGAAGSDVRAPWAPFVGDGRLRFAV